MSLSPLRSAKRDEGMEVDSYHADPHAYDYERQTRQQEDGARDRDRAERSAQRPARRRGVNAVRRRPLVRDRTTRLLMHTEGGTRSLRYMRREMAVRRRRRSSSRCTHHPRTDSARRGRFTTPAQTPATTRMPPHDLVRQPALLPQLLIIVGRGGLLERQRIPTQLGPALAHTHRRIRRCSAPWCSSIREAGLGLGCRWSGLGQCRSRAAL
ncbi:hypothetical protein B0H16DRAFT_1576152 [Mycena metata]|uniref:Uncharacterized protein n=1 Tax=Mycena metata TaxID=1033252 RepID=A0AAD7I5B4_9AGAR|nr:hypothetical protein B0H16DRAFT_1576152 [Mycena metata]